MKIKTKKAIRILATAAAMLAIAGCDDGELASFASPSIAPASPIIISFYADPSSISQGESTTIAWEVAGADKVEIIAVAADGSPVSFGVSTDQLSGSQAVNGLTATTDFVLTATKGAANLESEQPAAMKVLGGQIQFGPEEEEAPPAPEPSETVPAVSSVSQTITVNVVDSGRLEAVIAADSPMVDPGESTIIRWEVTPDDDIKEIAVVADTGEPIVPTDQCDGTMADILAQPALEKFPAKGCAVVSPDVKTEYTVNAMSNSGQQASASATVDVGYTRVNADIFAGLTESEKVEDVFEIDSYDKPVVISWQVTPAAAAVTITADGALGASTANAPCELPSNATDKAVGSTICMLTGQTTFKITAVYGGDSDTDTVTIFKQSAGTAGLRIAQQWAFPGERMTVRIELDSATKADPSAVDNVTMSGSSVDVAELKSQGYVVTEVTVGSDDVVVTLNSSGHNYDYPAVKAVNLLSKKNGSDEVAVSSIAYRKIGSKIVRYHGVELADYNDGKARMYDSDGQVEVPYMSHIMMMYGMDNMWNENFFDKVKRYPVAVAAGDDNANHVFAGVTGLLLRSKEFGGSWEPLMVTRRRAEKSYQYDPEGHDTCGYDAERDGQKKLFDKMANFNGDFISLNGICDVVVKGKRVIVATDFGVQTEVNIDNDKLSWYGSPDEGHSGSEYGFLTFGHVVNDLELAGQKAFAAADNGIFVSPASGDGADYLGVTWDQFSSSGQAPAAPVYALAYSESGDTIYAGASNGLFKSSVSSPKWEKIFGEDVVTSIALDPVSTSTIIAATPAGARITRNGGESWTKISDTAGVEKVAMFSEKKGEGAGYAVAIGTAGGLQHQEFYVAKTASAGGFAKIVKFVGAGDDVEVEKQYRMK